MKRQAQQFLFTLSISLLVASCAVGPDYERPDNSALLQDTFDQSLPASMQKSYTTRQWWHRLNDPVLNQYVSQLRKQNLSLMQTAERVVQAKELVRIQGGSLMPSISADGTGSRSFTTTSTSPRNRSYTNSYSGELSTSWEIDVFGRIRRNIESAKASFEASQYDHKALEQSLIAELLRTRVSIAINAKLLELAQKNVKSQKLIYDLVKRRYDTGVRSTSSSDVHLTAENVSTLQADVERIKRQLADATYRLDTLLGKAPGTTKMASTKFPLLPPPLDIPICVPASLLDRRPDIKASELRLKAANADIGIAVADLYPTLSLSGSLGVEGSSTNNLFTLDQLVGSLLGNITTRIFSGGALRANIRLKESRAKELAAQYAETILEAMRETESALNAEKTRQQELKRRKQSVSSLKKAENISESRYKKGIDTLRNFLEVQQRRYQQEQNLLVAQQERWNSRVDLYLALGGDWFGQGNQPLPCKAPLRNSRKHGDG